MKPTKFILAAVLSVGLASSAFAQAGSQAAGQWKAAWGFVPITLGPPPATPPVAPPTPNLSSYADVTVRQILKLTTGGDEIRVRFSNEFGSTMMKIGAARIGLAAADGSIVPGTERPLTFNGGQTSFNVPQFAPILTDPVKMKVAARQALAISVYLPEEVRSPAHRPSLFIAKGDQTAAATLTDPVTGRSGALVSRVEVRSAATKAVVVAFGDSITEGGSTSPVAYGSWPDSLADRIAKSPQAGKIAVVNAGVSGGRLLREGSGPAALARFDRDVCSVPGATHVILLEGINDIGNGQRRPPEDPTIEELVGAYRQIIQRSHDCGLKIFGATLTPYEGASYYSVAGEAKRQALNNFIRTSGAFDGVIDFEKATRDPAAPTKWNPAVQRGDNLHPNAAGYEAMAAAVDLKMFGVK